MSGRRPISGNTPVDGLMDHMTPYTFRYKNPADGMSADPNKNGGHFAGIMAQDLESDPHGLGKQIVATTPHGKMLEIKPLVSALTAGVGRLHGRSDAHEGMLAAIDAHVKDLHHKIGAHAAMLQKLHHIISRKVG